MPRVLNSQRSFYHIFSPKSIYFSQGVPSFSDFFLFFQKKECLFHFLEHFAAKNGKPFRKATKKLRAGNKFALFFLTNGNFGLIMFLLRNLFYIKE